MIVGPLSFKRNLLPVLVKVKLSFKTFLVFMLESWHFYQNDPGEPNFHNKSTSGLNESETEPKLSYFSC